MKRITMGFAIVLALGPGSHSLGAIPATSADLLIPSGPPPTATASATPATPAPAGSA